jgi:hypothetical protein
MLDEKSERLGATKRLSRVVRAAECDGTVTQPSDVAFTLLSLGG